MASPILPTPPVTGEDAEELLRSLERSASPEEMARRVALAEKALAYVMTPREPCPSCLPIPGAVNHVPGHIFVGWGRGWQPCIACGGSGVAPR